MLSRSALPGKGGHPSLAPKKECAIPPRFKNAGHPGAVSREPFGGETYVPQ